MATISLEYFKALVLSPWRARGGEGLKERKEEKRGWEKRKDGERMDPKGRNRKLLSYKWKGWKRDKGGNRDGGKEKTRQQRL